MRPWELYETGAIAAGRVQRAGFKRWWAEACLGKVDAVAAREVSRFVRNGRDWQQLIEMCGGRTCRVNLAIRFDNSLLSLAFSKPLLRLASYLFCEIGHPLGCGLAKRLFPW